MSRRWENVLKFLFIIMENVVTIFKKFETVGVTKDAAIKESGLNLRVDATQAYKKQFADKAANEADVKEWMKEYLNQESVRMERYMAITMNGKKPYGLVHTRLRTMLIRW